jgi:hypothetical protein
MANHGCSNLDQVGLDELSRKGVKATRNLRGLARPFLDEAGLENERAELAAQMRKTWRLLIAYHFPRIARFLGLK